MSKDLMRYDHMAQEALRGVVRQALEVVLSEGLPGEHHFFIAFSTTAPGVDVSDALKERYPEEMTIVLQHQFWDLEVHDDHFEVSLTFSKVLERLVVPYKAVKGFFDPSVQFGLQFQEPDSDNLGNALPAPESPKALPGDTSAEPPAEGGSNDSADVVNLDAFRKK